MAPDYLRLQRIIKSSKRAEAIRRGFGLLPTEYIVTFVDNETKVGNGKRTMMKKLTNAPKDMQQYAGKLLAQVQSDIVDYFDLALDAKTVRDALCMHSPYVPSSFGVIPSINKKTGHAQVTIEFYELPNPETREYLWQEILRTVQFFREFYKTKNTKGLRTTIPARFKADRIERFDEKFEITKRYEALRRINTGRHIPQADMGQLCADAKQLLGVNRQPNAQDIRKIADNFKRHLESV